jgi:hypothetical protein
MDVYQLLNRDARMDMRTEAISRSAIPVKEYDQRLVFDNPKDVAPLYLSPEALDMRDLGIEAQMQKISKNSIKEVAGWKPSKIMSHVTEEMIKDYQDEMHNTHYEDPITGQKLRYVPAGADIDLEIPTLNIVFTQDELTELRDENAAVAQDIRDYNDMLTSLYQYRKDLMDFEIVKPSPYTKGNYKREYEDYLQQMGARQAELDRLVRSEEGIKNEILKAEYHIEQNELAIKDNTKVIADNQAEQSRTEKINRGLLQAKSDQLMVLNRGRMNVTQGVNEPSEDYKQRLLDIGAETYDVTTITESARLRNVDRFKTSMKELFRDDVLISSLVKEISARDPDSIYTYNKFMIPIKKKFLETFGFASKDLKTESIPDIIDFFDNVVAKASLKPVATPRVFAEPRVEIPWTGRAKITDITREAVPRTGFSMDELLAGVTLKPSGSRTLKPAPVSKKSGVAEMREIVSRRKEKSEPLSASTMTADELRSQFDSQYYLRTGKHLRSNGTASTLMMQLTDSGVIEGVPATVGFGITDRKLPKVAGFGKIAVNPHQLYYNNMLIIMRPSGKHFPGYKNIRVSDAVVSVFMKLLDGETVKHDDFKMFTMNERELYDNVIHLAGLHKKVEHNLEHTKKAMKQRLELIEGEIGAGNTNHMLKKEVQELLLKMSHGGMITRRQAYSHLKNLTGHF